MKQEKKKESALIPGLFLTGLLILLMLIAGTSLFSPLVRFIHIQQAALASSSCAWVLGLGALGSLQAVDILCSHLRPLFFG